MYLFAMIEANLAHLSLFLPGTAAEASAASSAAPSRRVSALRQVRIAAEAVEHSVAPLCFLGVTLFHITGVCPT